MKFIKCSSGNYVRVDAVNEFLVSCAHFATGQNDEDEWEVLACFGEGPDGADLTTIAEFRTETEAKAYLDKLIGFIS